MPDGDQINRRHDVQVVLQPTSPPDVECREFAFDIGGVRFGVIDSAQENIAARVERLLSLQMQPSSSGGGTRDVVYAIEPWRPRWSPGDGWRIAKNGSLRHLGRDIDRAAQWLRADIDATIARRRGAVRIEADVVAWRQHAIVILRHERCGTSTLAAELVRRGATLQAQRLAVLDLVGRARPRTAAPPLPVALVVATTYRPQAPWPPRPLRGARAVLPIIDSALAGGNAPRQLLRLCASLAVRVVSLQGPRPDAATAVPAILASVDEWLDGDARLGTPAASSGGGVLLPQLLVRAGTGPATR